MRKLGNGCLDVCKFLQAKKVEFSWNWSLMMIRANLTLLRSRHKIHCRRHRPAKGHSRPRIHHGNNTEIFFPHFGHISSSVIRPSPYFNFNSSACYYPLHRKQRETKRMLGQRKTSTNPCSHSSPINGWFTCSKCFKFLHEEYTKNCLVHKRKLYANGMQIHPRTLR